MQTELAYTTFKSDKTKMNRIIRDLGEHDIQNLKYSDIRTYINDLHQKYSASTVNAHKSLLNKIYIHAIADGVVNTNPITQISCFKRDIEEPQPFTLEEIDAILNYQSVSLSEKLLFKLGIYTGLRISELLALCWEDIDLQKRILLVRRSVIDSKYRVPKTAKSARSVELSEDACDVLKQLEQHTAYLRAKFISIVQSDNHTVKKEKVRFIFINSKTKKPFTGSKQYAYSFFTPLLNRLNIKHRGPGHMRHTYASQSLTCGAPISWISTQMGHTSSQLTERRYARWITQNNRANYADQLATHIGTANNKQIVLPSRSKFEQENDSAITDLLNLLISKPVLAEALLASRK